MVLDTLEFPAPHALLWHDHCCAKLSSVRHELDQLSYNAAGVPLLHMVVQLS
jgi:hypothetical protein